MWRKFPWALISCALIVGCGGNGGNGGGGDDGNNGYTPPSRLECTNGEEFSPYPQPRPLDRGRVALGEPATLNEPVEDSEEPGGTVGWAIDGVTGGDVITVAATTPNDSVDVTLALIDLDACEYLVTDNLSPIADSESTLGYEVSEGDVLGAAISWAPDSFEDIEGNSVELELDVQSGAPSRSFCNTSADSLTVGETVQGELELASDDQDGPLGEVYDVYSVELEAGQTVDPQVDAEEGIIMDEFIYNANCIRMLPVPQYLRSSPEAESNEPFTAPEAGTYRFYVSSYNGTTGTYEATLVEP